MPEIETSPKNVIFADRIQQLLVECDRRLPSPEEILELKILLSSLTLTSQPNVLRKEYSDRKKLLTPSAELSRPMAGRSPATTVVSAAYLGFEREYGDGGFQNLPAGFIFPAFSIWFRSDHRQIMYVPTPYGLLPNKVISPADQDRYLPEGAIFTLTPQYFLNLEGQGLRLNLVGLSRNFLDNPTKAELFAARKINFTPDPYNASSITFHLEDLDYCFLAPILPDMTAVSKP